MPRVLCSVSDKTGLIDFARALAALGWDIVASGGTGKALENAGLPVVSVEQITGQPEMLGGRVKTLHPAIHAGLLARDSSGDLAELARHGIAPISMVVCNLYPFAETVRAADVTESQAIEQIDIGGVALLRASAKNYERVTTLCDPADYARVLEALHADGHTDLAARRQLAIKAFAMTRDYDAAIHAWLADADMPKATDAVPPALSLNLMRGDALRYGENPHQMAAYYAPQPKAMPLGARQLGGKQLSYNNILDSDAAWRAVSSFTEPTVVIVKHLTPTGIASAGSALEAFPKALASDPLSAFGGIVAVNQPVDDELVAALGALFVEVIMAPDFSQGALEQLRGRRKNCRILQVSQRHDGGYLELRAVMGGMLLQSADTGDPPSAVMRTVSQRVPTATELESLRFAWRAAQHVKSNAIVLARGKRTVGIGGGLPSRVDAAELAIRKAGAEAAGSALASDAFFPFPDSIELAARAGIACVIQPGGSIRDAEVIAAADAADMAMVFTGARHFRH